jgi:hypothetical protein
MKDFHTSVNSLYFVVFLTTIYADEVHQVFMNCDSKHFNINYGRAGNIKLFYE